jgi:hypothetical protein
VNDDDDTPMKWHINITAKDDDDTPDIIQLRTMMMTHLWHNITVNDDDDTPMKWHINITAKDDDDTPINFNLYIYLFKGKFGLKLISQI